MDEEKVILLTGANSGIGFALANLLYKSSYRVIATARPQSISELQEKLPEHKSFAILPLDLTSYDSMDNLIELAKKKFQRVDILINNAGVSYRSVVEHMNRMEEKLQLKINYFGPMKLIRGFLPTMRHRCFGKIVNVSSVGGLMAMPTMGSYSASKFALEGASEALWYELRPWNISVSLIQLGFVRSDSYKKVYWSESAKFANEDQSDDYHIYYKYMSGFVERFMQLSLATPEKIAKRIMKIVEKDNPPLRAPVTLDAHLFFWIRRILPRSIYHRVLYRSLPHIKEWEKKAQEVMRKNT